MKPSPFWKVSSERSAAMRETKLTLDPAQTGSESKTLEAMLHALVVGQDEAIEQIVNVYQTCLTGLIPPRRTIGNGLFLGATGSGKTRMVEATAESQGQSPGQSSRLIARSFSAATKSQNWMGSPFKVESL
jgi:ATP-dependent Clp protease ATP-binding subunit ClpB